MTGIPKKLHRTFNLWTMYFIGIAFNRGLGNIKKRPLPCKLSDNFGEWLEFDIDTSTGARDQPGKPRVLVRVRVGLGTGVRVDQWDAD